MTALLNTVTSMFTGYTKPKKITLSQVDQKIKLVNEKLKTLSGEKKQSLEKKLDRLKQIRKKLVVQKGGKKYSKKKTMKTKRGGSSCGNKRKHKRKK